MYLPHTAVFPNRVYNRRRHDVKAEQQKAKNTIRNLVKVVVLVVVLMILTICGLGGMFGTTMISQRNADTKIEVLSLENEHMLTKLNSGWVSTTEYRKLQDQVEKLQGQVETQSKLNSGWVSTTEYRKLQDQVEKLQGQVETQSKLNSGWVSTTEYRKLQDQVETQSNLINKLEVLAEKQNNALNYVTEGLASTNRSFEILEESQTTLNGQLNAVTEKLSTTDGVWSVWSAWGTCSATCNGGQMTRTRTCTNPSPSQFGRDCRGNDMDYNICNARNCPGQQVAFTAQGATGKLVRTVLTFRNVYLNLGGGYSQTTGTFTCPVNGIYLFSATLISAFTRNSPTYCHIRKNGSNVVLVYSQEGPWDSASVSAIVRLSVRDLVDLGHCGSNNYINTADMYTSFTGFLIQAD